MPLSAGEIRERFLRFFEGHGHRRVASSSLVPDQDPTLLFTNAGMVQFKRTFLGEENRGYATATTSQKCMRVSGKHNDLENVGRTPRHHTFFEMLGNFSFGDYFKADAITYAWEFLTGELGIEADRLVATVFREDDEARGLWLEVIGLPEERVLRLDEEENFWSMGDTGPCGPCSEIHVDFGVNADCTSEVCDPSCGCGRWLEIWNLVFMQYDRNAGGELIPLPRPSIDTGAGLERLAAVLQDVPTNFDTDLFTGILARAQDVAGVTRGEDLEKDVSLNVVADHARALTFLIGDGVLPANEGRGYVLRRILRRAARHGVMLGVEEPFLYRVADAVVDEMVPAYPELAERRAFICDRIRREEERFLQTLSNGLQVLEEEIQRIAGSGKHELPGEIVFRLYDTFGFPVDLTADILLGHDLALDQPGFDSAMAAQRARARAAWKGSGDERVGSLYGELAAQYPTRFCGYETLSAESTVCALLVEEERREVVGDGDEIELVSELTPFYAESGGQVGDRGSIETESGRIEILDTRRPSGDLVVHRGRVAAGEVSEGQQARFHVDPESRAATVRNHSGTHLLHAALRQVLGAQAMQKGSLVAPERLRFDFTHDAPLSAEEIAKIEDLANDWIASNSPAQTKVMAYDEAIQAGAVAIFEEKYGDEVRVVSFGKFSTELCGGTHARATGDIGLLKIVSENGVASGVRRIEALTGRGALNYLREQERTLAQLSEILHAPVTELPARIERLLSERKAAEQEIASLRAAERGDLAADLSEQAREIAGIKVVTARVEGVAAPDLRDMIDALRDRLGHGVALLASEQKGSLAMAVGVTPDLTEHIKAGALMRELATVVGGKGGGRPDFAQGGGGDASRLDEAFAKFDELVASAAP